MSDEKIDPALTPDEWAVIRDLASMGATKVGGPEMARMVRELVDRARKRLGGFTPDDLLTIEHAVTTEEEAAFEQGGKGDPAVLAAYESLHSRILALLPPESKTATIEFPVVVQFEP